MRVRHTRVALVLSMILITVLLDLGEKLGYNHIHLIQGTQLQWSPYYKQASPKHLGYAQSLTHAEAHSLIRAYERQGVMPKKVTMFVDRKTCNICRGELPALLNSMGIEELLIYSGGSDIPIIIKP